MSNIFSLEVVRENVQKQMSVSHELLDVVAEIQEIQEATKDEALKNQLSEITVKLVSFSRQLLRNASETGKEVVRSVRAS